MKNTRVILSTLWIVVMINMLKADILSLYIPGVEEEMAAFAGDTPIATIMLFAANFYRHDFSFTCVAL